MIKLKQTQFLVKIRWYILQDLTKIGICTTEFFMQSHQHSMKNTNVVNLGNVFTIYDYN